MQLEMFATSLHHSDAISTMSTAVDLQHTLSLALVVIDLATDKCASVTAMKLPLSIYFLTCNFELINIHPNNFCEWGSHTK